MSQCFGFQLEPQFDLKKVQQQIIFKQKSNNTITGSGLIVGRHCTRMSRVSPRLSRFWAGLKPHQVIQPAPSDARPALIL